MLVFYACKKWDVCAKMTATQRWKRPGLFHPYAGMVLDVSCYAVILALTDYLSI